MKGPFTDYILLWTTMLLLVLGILTLAGVSASLSLEKFGNSYYFLKHQLLFGLIPGLILSFLAFRIPIPLFKKWAPVSLLINLVLAAMVFLPKIGSGFRGATRWVSVGPISFQPSEFLKLTFILYLATWLSSRTEKIASVKKASKSLPAIWRMKKDQQLKVFSQTLIVFLIVVGIVSLLLIFQPDISTLGVIAICAALMYFSADTPVWHSFLITLIGFSGLLSLIKIAPYRMARFLVFLKPEIDPMGMGYQIKQALIAVGSGGIMGLGLGMSRQFGFLPQSISDSIFAIFSEETGFVGSLILILLFVIFLWQGLKIGKLSKDKFSKLAVIGITCWITLQAFVNISSMLGLLPLTGIPLPFISYGGSHLLAELIGVGILLNISKNTT